MWRALPSLSGATCPAGSKTSCCKSFIIFTQKSLVLFWSPLQPFESFFFSVHPKCPLSLHCSTQLLRPESVHPPPTSASSSFPSALPQYLCRSYPPLLHFGSPPAHLSSPLSVLLNAASDLHLLSPSSLLSLPYFTPTLSLPSSHIAILSASLTALRTQLLGLGLAFFH